MFLYEEMHLEKTDVYHLSDLEQVGVSNNSKEIEDIMFTKTPFVFYNLPHNLDLLVN